VALLNSAQRITLLWEICAYRTVSMTATNVMAAVPPADLPAVECETQFIVRRGIATRIDDWVTPRSVTIRARGRRLWTADDGAWTKRLVPCIDDWCNRRHGQIEYHLTQFMSGHGCYSCYLHNIGKESSPGCHHCDSQLDDAAHTVFECTAWVAERASMFHVLGCQLDEDNFLETMLQSDQCWEVVALFCRTVIRAEEDAERLRQQQSWDGWLVD